MLTNQAALLGNWTGDNLLRTSWLTPPEHHSAGTMSVRSLGQGKFLSFEYTWSHDGSPHKGFLLLARDEKRDIATTAWVDSWHMTDKILSCAGSLDDSGVIDVRGSYEAPHGPNWGWRIVISAPAADSLEMVMYNITPLGEEDLAVRATYQRISD